MRLAITACRLSVRLRFVLVADNGIHSMNQRGGPSINTFFPAWGIPVCVVENRVGTREPLVYSFTRRMYTKNVAAITAGASACPGAIGMHGYPTRTRMVSESSGIYWSSEVLSTMLNRD